MLIPEAIGLSLVNIIDVHPMVPSMGSGDPTPKYLNQLKLLSTLSGNSDLEDKYKRYFTLVKDPFFGSTISACVTLAALTILFLGTVTGMAISTAPLCTGALISVIGLVAGIAANYFSSKRIKNAKSDLEKHLNANKSALRCLLTTEIANKENKIGEIIDKETNIKTASAKTLSEILNARQIADFAKKTLEDFFSSEDVNFKEMVV